MCFGSLDDVVKLGVGDNGLDVVIVRVIDLILIVLFFGGGLLLFLEIGLL